MTDVMFPADAASDAELISAVRLGDSAAYGDLFARHQDAARRMAAQLVRGPDIDDLVSEAFTKVFVLLQEGRGPDVAFRAYLLTSIRRLHVDKIRAGQRVQPTDEIEQLDSGVEFVDPAVMKFEHGATATAFASLPERWQLVLWHLDVEGAKPAEIAPLLGMSANSVSALAYRAREGLKQAYLQSHLADTGDQTCRWTTEHLGAYVRNGLSKRDSGKVREHLDTCRSCTAVYLELTEVNSNLKGILAPILLGGAAGGYLAAGGSNVAVLGLLGSGFDKTKNWVTANAANAGIAVAGALVVAVGATGAIYLAVNGTDDSVTVSDPGQSQAAPDDDSADSPGTSPDDADDANPSSGQPGNGPAPDSRPPAAVPGPPPLVSPTGGTTGPGAGAPSGDSSGGTGSSGPSGGPGGASEGDGNGGSGGSGGNGNGGNGNGGNGNGGNGGNGNGGNGNGNGGNGNGNGGTTTPPTPDAPASPGGVTAVDGPDGVTITWAAAARAESYQVFRAQSTTTVAAFVIGASLRSAPAGPDPIGTVGATTLTYTDPSPPYGSGVDYWVVAVNEGGSTASEHFTIARLPDQGEITTYGTESEDRCLSVGGPAEAPQVVAESCDGSARQTWKVSDDTITHAGRCLAVGGPMADDPSTKGDESGLTAATLTTCDDSTHWRFGQTGRRQAIVSLSAEGRALDVAWNLDWSPGDPPTPVIVYETSGGRNQLFSLPIAGQEQPS